MDTKKNNLENFIKVQSEEKCIDIQKNKMFKIGIRMFSLPYETIEYFSPYCMKTKSNKRWGLVDFDGKEIIPCRFGYIDNLENGYAKTGISKILKKLNPGLQIGLISEKGEIIIPMAYSNYNKIDDDFFLISKSFHKCRTQGSYYSVEKSGIYNIKEKREILPCIYDELNFFVNGLVEVKIKIQKDQYNYTTFKGNLNTEGKSLLENGKNIYLSYDLIEKREDGYFSFIKNGLMGVMDSNENIIIDAKYSIINNFIEGKAIVLNHIEQNVYPEYGAWYTNHKYNYGFINESNEEFVKCIFDEVSQFSCNLARVKSNEKYGFVDLTGNVVIPIQYEHASNFNNDVSIVQKIEQILVPQEYRNLVYNIKDNVVSKNFYMLINQNGEKITNYLYEDISYTKCGIYKVKLNCKSGYIDNNGTTIISIIYDYISDFAEGLSVCSIIDEKGYRKYGFIDINNKIIVPIIYDYAENYSDGVAIIKKMTDVNNGKKYYEYQVNKKGEILELKEYFEENIVETSDDYYESNNSYDNEEPNYAEDTWDAMTDGMYGDYPGGEVDYDNLGF